MLGSIRLGTNLIASLASVALILLIAFFGSVARAQDAQMREASPGRALYVASGFVSVFEKAKLGKSGAVNPNFAFRAGGVRSSIMSVAFDSAGTMWASISQGGGYSGYLAALKRTSLRRLRQKGKAPFDVLIGPTNQYEYQLYAPRQIQFDPSGNLWVLVDGSGTPSLTNIVEYSADQLATNGDPTPATLLTVSGPCASTKCLVVNMKLDADGNLWVAAIVGAFGENAELMKFSRAQLSAGGSLELAPDFTIIALSSAQYLTNLTFTFDSTGDLWLGRSYSLAPDVVMYPSAQLTGNGTISAYPAVVLSPIILHKRRSISSPESLAFDDKNDLWVSGEDNRGTLAEFAPTQLTADGAPNPTAFVYSNTKVTNLGFPALLSFGPLLP